MWLSAPARVEAYRAQGWWRGETVDAVFHRALATGPEREALVDPPNRADLAPGAPQRLTYRELNIRIDQMAQAFIAVGVGRGDVVCAQLPNIVEGVIAFLAAARLGAILSPIAMAYRAHELRWILPRVKPKAILTVPSFHGHPYADMMAKLGADGLHTAGLLVVGEPALEAASASAVAPPADLDANEALTICWTSGTEADPKGVPRHHDHWVVNGEALAEAAELTSGDTLLNPFPLINIAAFGGMVMPWLLVGGRLVQHHPFDLPLFLRQLASERVAYTVAPPAILTMLLKNDALLAATDVSALRCLGSGSAPLPPFMVRGWQERLGVPVMNIFGSNEGCSLFTASVDVPDPEQRARFFPRFGAAGVGWTSGFPAKVRTRLVDPDTEAEITRPGVGGELRIDGAMTFDGYWRGDGTLDRSAFDTAGYFRTGDLFEIAEEGGGRFYRFIGRRKEIIIRGGINISPAELDALIESHPKVREAACAAYPDERLGERVCAIVALKPGETLTLDDLLSHLAATEIAQHKMPEKLRIVDALPRNALGKVLRRDLAGVAAS